MLDYVLPGALIAVLLFVLAFTNDEGLWGNLLNFFNVLLAALLAMNFFEPVASWMDARYPAYGILFDLMAWWLTFAIAFMLLRTVTDRISRYRVRFVKSVETTGRVFFGLWTGWLMVCFLAASLHVAPLARNILFRGFRPEDRCFFGIGPDRLWLGFTQRMSRSSLSRMAGESNPEAHVFDADGKFMPMYAARRENYESLEGLAGVEEYKLPQ